MESTREPPGLPLPARATRLPRARAREGEGRGEGLFCWAMPVGLVWRNWEDAMNSDRLLAALTVAAALAALAEAAAALAALDETACVIC